MKEQFDMSTVHYPCGILHDQKLIKVKYDNNKMIFTFGIEVFPENYTDDFYKKYESFNQCDMIVELQDEPLNCFQFVSCPRKGKFKGISFNSEFFVDVINNASSVTFVECSATYGEFQIELCIGYYDAKRPYKKYNKYDMCNIILDAKIITWDWH